MELMPDHADSHRLLSGLRVDEMRWQEAAVLARRAVALKPADIDAHNALATALAGPDAGNDWRGRGAGEHAEEAMHHFRRGLQLEAGEESEPASLVLQALHNESALESDGTFVLTLTLTLTLNLTLTLTLTAGCGAPSRCADGLPTCSRSSLGGTTRGAP